MQTSFLIKHLIERKIKQVILPRQVVKSKYKLDNISALKLGFLGWQSLSNKVLA
jgi:hypothetical protein